MAELIVSIADECEAEIDELERCFACEDLVRCRDCRFREDPQSIISEWLPCQFGQTSDDWFCASGRAKKRATPQ